MMFANLSPWHLRELHQQNQPSRAQDSQTARNATRQCVVFAHEVLRIHPESQIHFISMVPLPRCCHQNDDPEYTPSNQKNAKGSRESGMGFL